jgi:hypothetical protein
MMPRDGPQILPVTYACHDGTIIFRTSPHGVLSELVRPTDVALEIDELDQERRHGWSVVVPGRAQIAAASWDLRPSHDDLGFPVERTGCGAACNARLAACRAPPGDHS